MRQWIWQRMYKEYGFEHDYYGNNEPPAKLSSVVDVLSALHKVVYYHPTKSVRSQAEALRSNISSHYNSVSDDRAKVGGTPDEDDLSRWLDFADKLIELIHTPPSLDEVRRPASDEIAENPPPKAISEKPKLKALGVVKRYLRRKAKEPEDISDLFET